MCAAHYRRFFFPALPGWVLAFALLAAGCASTAETAETPAAADTTAAEALPPPEVPRTVPRTVRTPAADAGLDTVRAGRFDSGRMWTFEDPPVAYLRETYGFAPDEAWFEHARLGALRLPNCTASFVSPNGLVMTNHHCARGPVTLVTRPGEDLLEEGFYAETRAEERRVPDLYVDQLIEIVDVTEEVDTAVEGAQTEAERAQARAEVIEAITGRLTREAGDEDIVVQVISLYNGARYSAYVFRRYDDVRLVMAPELQVAYYGGDYDNFTFPRYALDMSFLRVYGDDGTPLETPYYFRWSEEGASEGDLVFVVGNPGSTNRLETVAQLEYRRDIGERYLLDFIDRRVEALEAYYAENPSEEILNELFSLRNAQKAYRGRLEGLNDPVLLARRRDTERQLLEAIEERPALRAEYGGLVEQIADIQAEKRALAADIGAFLLLPNSGFSSATLRRAMLAYNYMTLRRGGAPEERLAQLRQEILAIEDQPRGLEERYLTARFEAWQSFFGEDSMILKEVLMGRPPEEQAEIVLRESAFADSAGTARALQGDLSTQEDPALLIASYVMPRFTQFQSALAGLNARQQELAARLGRARYEIYGTDIPPDATFSLRIADGIVQGYPYNGTMAPPYTTYYGLYDHYYSYAPDFEEWDLPARWLTPPEAFALETPMNLVSTNDIIGGNSGSPLLNRDLEIVGLVFDGNIESLPGSFIYVPELARTVSVDARGIVEALDDIYDADRVVLELTTGRFLETEAEADAVLSTRR